MSLWLAAAFLTNIGFDVMTIRSVHTAEERTTACAQFNDPANPVKILLCSLKTTAASVNLQLACSDVLFFDVPINGNTIFQAIGRIYWIGQRRAIWAWMLTLDHTHDQVLQARCANKMMSNIAGTAAYEPTPQDIADYLTGADEEPRSRDLTESEINRIRERKSIALCVRCLGQVTPTRTMYSFI